MSATCTHGPDSQVNACPGCRPLTELAASIIVAGANQQAQAAFFRQAVNYLASCTITGGQGQRAMEWVDGYKTAMNLLEARADALDPDGRRSQEVRGREE